MIISPRPSLYVLGHLYIFLSVAFTLAALVDLFSDSLDWQIFLLSAAVSLFSGVGLVLATRGHDEAIDIRQTFLVTAVSWAGVSLMGALPFALSKLHLDIADAVFESVSGLTTTGSTVIVGLDYVPPGILFWRAFLQWIGGLGVITSVVLILPQLRVGGMQIFRVESSDVQELSGSQLRGLLVPIFAFYSILTIVCTVLLKIAGMSTFAAFCHAMTAISTGGFGTHDSSIAYYHNRAVEGVLMVFMLLGAMTFPVLIAAARGQIGVLWRDTQIRFFLLYVAFFILVTTLWRVIVHEDGLSRALWGSSFNIISIVTTTGFVSEDYSRWGPVAEVSFLFLIFLGGCSGSTTGGIKAFRLYLLMATARQQLITLIRPHQIVNIIFNRRKVETGVIHAVLGFLWFYGVTVIVVTLILAATGLDLVTSLSGTAQALSNVGPGLGPIVGPAGNYSSLTDTAKWALSAAMLLGRLELLPVLLLFIPSFWRQ